MSALSHCLLSLLAAAPQSEIVCEHWLVVDPVDGSGRRPFRPDAVLARYLLAPGEPGELGASSPREGETLTGERGAGAWRAARADERGAVHGRIGYAFTRVEPEEPGVFLARLAGASTLFVNGRGHAGDLYRFGFGGVPVALGAGANELFVTGARGGFDLELARTSERLLFGDWDVTKPKLVAGKGVRGALGVLLINASRHWSGKLLVEYGPAGPIDAGSEFLPGGIDALGLLKVGLPLAGGVVPADVASIELPVRVSAASRSTTDVSTGETEVRTHGIELELSVTLEVQPAGAQMLRTFLSELDRSAQEYSVLPPAEEPAFEGERGLVLSLHGAGVNAWGQAACYRRKPDFWIVAPTNRRPFGFDWQDWGRRDAYEVLARELESTGVQGGRVYVTGHSMGGHGTWHLVANDPDRFAACGPSAAWESFDSYGGRPAGEWSAVWHAADGASSTLALIENLGQVPAYVLHGSADDTVRASEALRMIEALTRADATFDAHVQGGAGHWWGNQCMDWEPIFDTFRAHVVEADPQVLDFTSVDPGVDSRHHWVRVEQPLEYGERLRVRATRDAETNEARVTTENVGWLALERELAAALLDEQHFELEGPPPYAFARSGAAWEPCAPLPPAARKSAARSGPLKRAFERRFVLVYGQAGDDEEDALLGARAQYDAALWWYRGNGRAEVVSDARFLGSPRDYQERNVILYGNRDSNVAWDSVLGEDCPIDARRGSLVVGGTVEAGEGTSAVFVYPRKGDSESLVGAFATTDAVGARIGYTLAPFVSGVGYPDYVIYDARVLESGDGGVRAAGWFDAGWRLSETD